MSNDEVKRYIAKALWRLPQWVDRLEKAVTFFKGWFSELGTYADEIKQFLIIAREMQAQQHTANEQVYEIARELEQYNETLINILEIVSADRPKPHAIKKATGYLRNLKEKRIAALEKAIERLYSNLNQLEVDAASLLVIPVDLRNQINDTKERISEKEAELKEAKQE